MAVATVATRRYQNYVNGQLVDPQGHKMLTVENPATGQIVSEVPDSSAEDAREAIELAAYAKQAGADMSLSVVPYYNKPTQEGLYRHFRAIAEAVDIPQIVYNVPGRTVADLANDTMLRLAQVPNITGLKDATANIERGCDLLRRLPADFAVYSGDDATVSN